MRRDIRPLDPIPSLKLKLSAVIFTAVGVTVMVFWIGVKLGVYPSIAGILAATCALVMVKILAHGLTSPLREMATATEAMARGDYERRVTATSRDEIGALARAFNKMASELAETDHLRRELIANVSHELRTPIASLQVRLENLVDGVEQPDTETLTMMLRQAQRLGRLVAQVLDLSRLEAGTVPIVKSAFAVGPILRDAVSESTFRSPHVTVDVTIESPDLAAHGDPERVHQVVANLLENAVRYSPLGGTVQVRAGRENGHVRIEVADEGPGIPGGESDRVFERFHRADAGAISS